jgi:hypothetical protein
MALHSRLHGIPLFRHLQPPADAASTAYKDEEWKTRYSDAAGCAWPARLNGVTGVVTGCWGLWIGSKKSYSR